MRRWLPHTLGLLTPLVTIAGLFLGKWWMGSTIFLALFIYPLIDFIAGKSEKVEPAKSEKPNSANQPPPHCHPITIG